MAIKTQLGILLVEGSSPTSAANVHSLLESFGLPLDGATLTFHTHPVEPDAIAINYPSYADYYNLDNQRQRLDLIITDAGIYNLSYDPQETRHPVDGFTDFLKQHGVTHSQSLQEMYQEDTGKTYFLLRELPVEKQQFFYQSYEKTRLGPKRRLIPWNDSEIQRILKLLNQ